MKSLQIDILREVLTVLNYGNHFKNNLGHQLFGVLDNNRKCAGIPT